MYIHLQTPDLAIALGPRHLRPDPVVGIPDRFGLADILEQLLQHAAQNQATAACYVIGLDRMQMIAQAFGSGVVDEVLQAVGARLQSFVATQGWDDRAHLCWLGGDRFALVLAGANYGVLRQQGEALLRFLSDPADWPRGIHISASVGGVLLPHQASTSASVMTAAEQALQSAKQSGRNCFRIYQPQSDKNAAMRDALLLAEKVRRALETDMIQLAYQPIVCSSSGKTLFYEALARLIGEDGQTIPAAEFIPAVEQMGLAYDLDCRVLALAVEELKDHSDLHLSVNICATTSAREDWNDYLRATLEGRRDLAGRLIIEITETLEIKDLPATQKFVTLTRALGGQVAIDDFGAGYTTLKHLRELAVQIMKIDRDLVTGISEKVEQQNLLRSMIGMARSLGMKIVAEGVEDQAAAAWLREEKVDYQQGWLHGRPQLGRPWRQIA